MIYSSQKIFLIINLSYFGDVLLTNALCQNIKLNYPDSKVVFLVNKPFYEAAKYQEGVDEVITIDKRGCHGGITGLINFVKQCEYSGKVYAAFIIYGNDRGILISYLLRSHIRISGPTRLSKYLLTDIHIETDGFKNMQDINGNFIKALTGKTAKILPLKYKTNADTDLFVQNLKQEFSDKDIIGLCCISKQKAKDMPIGTAIDIINLANKNNKVIFYLGAGTESRSFADNIKRRGCVNFIDLTNITTIKQLANILTICNVLISVDTGTMHLACAVNTPVASVFYRADMIEKWAPREFLYKSTVISDDYSATNIYNKALALAALTNEKHTAVKNQT